MICISTCFSFLFFSNCGVPGAGFRGGEIFTLVIKGAERFYQLNYIHFAEQVNNKLISKY